MTSLINNYNSIQTAPNMVSIEMTILTDVMATYMNLFAKHVNLPCECGGQVAFVSQVNIAFAHQIAADRLFLFNAIPDRFKVTKMYKELQARIN